MKLNSTDAHDTKVEYILTGSNLKKYKIRLDSIHYTCEKIKEMAKSKFGIAMLSIDEERKLQKPLSKYLKKKLLVTS